MATINVVAAFMPALAAADMRPMSRRAWSQVTVSHATSSCWLFVTTCSWAPPLNASLAFWLTRGVDVSGRTILRWVQKFGPALADEIRRHRKPVSSTWLIDETYVKILGKWHYLYRGVDLDGQVLDCWLSATRDLSAADAFFRRSIASSGGVPEHVVTDKATFYPSAIRAHAPTARHTATGFYNRVISTNRCERNHGYVKSRLRTMRGLKSFGCATRLFPSRDAMQLIERGFVAAAPSGRSHTGGRTYMRARRIAAIVMQLGQRV